MSLIQHVKIGERAFSSELPKRVGETGRRG